MQTRRKRLAFSSITIISILMLLEVLFQILAIMFPKVNVLLSQTETVKTIDTINVIKDEKLGWRPNPQHPEHDSKGFRNKNVPSKTDIVALGDSQTYGTGVASFETWPQQLELLSGKITYNMAFGGYGPVHSLMLLEEAIDLKPELIIEALFMGNDLYDSFSLVYDQNQLPELKSNDPDTLRIVAKLEATESITEHVERLYNTMSVMQIERKFGHSIRDFLSDYSKLYGLLRAIKTCFKNVFHANQTDQVAWKTIESIAKHKKDYTLYNNGQFKTVFRPGYRHIALDINDLRIVEGHRISLEAIRRMNNRTAQEGIKFLVLLIPTKELTFKDIVQRDRLILEKSYQLLNTNEELFLQRTKTFLTEHGIDFVDGLQVLRECLENGRQPFPISWDGHLNNIGHRSIAEHIFLKIIDKEYFRTNTF